MLTRLDLRGPDADPRVALAAASTAVDEPVEIVREIIADVRRRGDAAVRDFTARFDGCEIDELRVPAEELTAVAEESGQLGDGLSGTVDELFLRTRKR